MKLKIRNSKLFQFESSLTIIVNRYPPLFFLRRDFTRECQSIFFSHRQAFGARCVFPSDVGACVYEYARQLNAVDDPFVIDRTLLARQRSLSRDSPQRLEGWLDLARLLIDLGFEIRVRGRRSPDRSWVESEMSAH